MVPFHLSGLSTSALQHPPLTALGSPHQSLRLHNAPSAPTQETSSTHALQQTNALPRPPPTAYEPVRRPSDLFSTPRLQPLLPDSHLPRNLQHQSTLKRTVTTLFHQKLKKETHHPMMLSFLPLLLLSLPLLSSAVPLQALLASLPGPLSNPSCSLYKSCSQPHATLTKQYRNSSSESQWQFDSVC